MIKKRVRIYTRIFLFIIFIFTILMAPSLKADAPDSVTINTQSDLTTFVSEYNGGTKYASNVTVTLASTETGSTLNMEELGTSTFPFNGTIIIGGSNVNTFSATAPIFNYITTDAKIVVDGSVGADPREITIIRTQTDDMSPLFAAHVVKGASNTGVTWKIKAYYDSSDGFNKKGRDFEGLIGDVASEAKLTVEFSHDSVYYDSTNNVYSIGQVTSSSDLGLICNNLGASAELTAKVTTTRQFSITSTGGHVGGFVGNMAAGSKLIVDCDGLDVDTISTSASDKYVGGLVGYMANGASIEFTGDYETTANITASNNIAGGLVGYANNASITTSDTITLSSTVEGKNSAGGVFGEYASSGSARTFDLSIYASDKTKLLLKSSNGYLGGIVAILNATNDVTFDGNITHTDGNKGTFARGLTFSTVASEKGAGGIIGKYSNNNLANTLLIQNNKVLIACASNDYTAGAIGFVDSTDYGNYIKIQDYVVKSENTLSAGLIAYAGAEGAASSKGNFIDLAGLQSLSGTYQAALIGESKAGVIRLAGKTDLGGSYSSIEAVTTDAQLINSRGNTLVYAKGSGSDANWSFYRAGSSTRLDDIGDWGEVLRGFSEGSGADDLFNVDMTAHTVTLTAAVPTNMASIYDFAKTALNICHNDGTNHEALLFADTTNNQTVLLSGTLSLSASLADPIDLNGTGLTGLTRDNGESPAFSGTFEGNNKEIALNVGADYSANSVTTTVTSSARGAGVIMKHQYTGLFAKTAGATIQKLKISGTIRYVTSGGGSKYIGSICAYNSGNLTITNVNTTNTIKVYLNSNCTIYCGALIGYISSPAGTTSIQSSTIASNILTSNADSSAVGQFSNCIGYVNQVSNMIINIGTNGNVELNGSYTYDTSASATHQANNKNVKYGGLIASFTAKSSDTAQVNINNLHVNSLSITKIGEASSRANGVGGLLGYYWPNTVVTIGTKGESDGLFIGENASTGPSITVNTNNTNIGALVYKATGTCKVNHVAVNKFTITNNTTSGFGFIANDTLNGDSALYLELFSEKYDIAATTIAGSGSFGVYDEVVGYTYVNGTDISDNGQAVISISAKSGSDYVLVMDGANTNTYQNQTTYGNNTLKYNPNARYYYNLDTIITKDSKSDAEKLLLWSLNIYAHSSIKSKFVSGFATGVIPGDDYDMIGLSYYPVNLNGTYTINGSTFKFYNKEIETGEACAAGNGNSDSYARTTIYASDVKTQHYLMHHSVFLNYQGTLNIRGQVELEGTVSYNAQGNYKSGYLISGVLGGDSINRAVFDCSGTGSIVLNGAYVHNLVSDNTPVTPLLIYRIATNTGLALKDLKMVGYDNFYTGNSKAAATSLIGTVGDTTSTGINLQFSNIVLDGRKTANSPNIGAYSSTKSIFKYATLLESFTYNTGSSGTYNFTYEEDWTGSPLHRVTYGYEIEHTVEFQEDSTSIENKYFTSDRYVNASTNPSTNNTAGDFDGFLPYVHIGYDANNKTHELSVNVASANIVEGCGKYNDPYVIENGKQLVAIANTIDGSNISTGLSLRLPYVIDGLDMWCESDSSDAAEKDYDYNFNGTNFISSYTINETNYEVSHDKDEVRAYLASAYYLINNNITIPTGYLGLGAVNASNATYDGPYAFRGVIVGKEQEGGGYPTITNNSTSPLITTSNGSVVKNVAVLHNASVSINQTTDARSAKFRYDNGGCKYFGAVMGQIMGGDNIIDNVSVTFGAGVQITFTSNKYNRLAPVGGYIGVLLNGALIFRNMSNANHTGLTSTNCSMLGNDYKDKWLYVNPIIGRVIAGYSFTETNAYVTEEASVTMKNGVKNYSIPDFDSTNNAPKIAVTADSNYNHIITLPNSGQALFLLAALINSGSCSATYNASTEQAYVTDADANLQWYAYRDNTAVRNGTYEYVGTNTNTDYNNNISGKDVFANVTATNDINAKIPYAVRKYTVAQNNMYRIRSVSNGENATGAVSQFNFASGGTYYLPASYRGIGSIYYISDKTIMVLQSLNGYNATINFSTYYEEYDAKTNANPTTSYSGNSYDVRLDENYGTTNFSGLGLFSHLKQLGVTRENDSSKIQNLTLSGSIFFDMRAISTGTPITYRWESKTENAVVDDFIMNVGGIAGATGNETTAGGQFRIENVTLDGVNFEGPKCVGGLIGFIHRSNEYTQTRIIKNCGSTPSGITIKAGLCAGGLIGLAFKHYLEIDGDTTNKTSLYIREICSKGTELAGYYTDKDNNARWWVKDKHVYTAGGLIGLMDVYDNKNYKVDGKTYSYGNVSHTYINNYKIIGVYDTNTANYQLSKKIYTNTEKSAAGCLIGTSKAAIAHIEKIEILKINIDAVYTGGIYGISWSDKPNVRYDVSEVTIDGKISDDYNSYLKGSTTTGGIFGDVEVTQTLTYNINDVLITNLTLETDMCIGGFLGYKHGSTQLTVKLNDFAIVDSEIISHYASAGDQTGTGGIVGIFGTTTAFTGYNIAIHNTSINHYNGSAITATNTINTVAYAVGNNVNAAAVILIAGLSIYGDNLDTLNQLVANSKQNNTITEYFGTNGYIVLTDYNGMAIDVEEDTYTNNFSTLYNSNKDLVAEYPYVTVSPQFNIGDSGFVLTGDGISSTVDAYVASSILNDATNRYLNASGKQLVGNSSAKISTFNTEQGTNFEDDFVVIIIDDFNRTTTTNLINAFINVLANTNGYNYATNTTGVYSTDVYMIEYDETESKFVKRNTEANLKKTGGEFYMVNNALDTSGKMFSLIDVSFLNPSNANEVVYHLYVPVLVKKMVKFDFKMAVLSGTNYDSTQYSSNFGITTMENLGTPITLYFEYTYLRSVEDWQMLLDVGDNLMINYTKNLTVEKTGSTFDNTTKMVLVDANKGGIPYYATWTSPTVTWSGSIGTIKLGEFNKALDGTGTDFAPCNLCDLLNITATQNNSGAYTKLNNSTGATTTALVNGVKYYFRPYASGDSSGNRYNLTVDSTNDIASGFAKERYYISLFTTASANNVLYNHTFTSPQSLQDANYNVPCNIEYTSQLTGGTGIIRLFMGNIFVQSNMNVSSETANLEISSTNDALEVDMACDVKIQDDIFDDVKNLLGENSRIQIYQSFLLYLVDKATSAKYIKGNPEVSGSYEISVIGNANVSSVQNAYSSFNITNVYVEFINGQSLNRFLVNGGARITSSVELQYIGDEAISEQFPVKEDINSTDIGIYTYATSNIAFDSSKTELSKVSVDASDNSKLYYCYSAGKKAKLYYNPKNDLVHGELSYLGINPLDSDGLTSVKVPTIATLDISTILSDAEDYDQVVCKIELYSKAVDSYETALDISKYWSSLNVCGSSVALSANGTSATITINRSLTEDAELDSTLSIPITFDVITGTPFENAGLTYSNFKVVVQVKLQKDGNDVLNSSIAENYLVYTNAKIYPDVIN